MSGPPPETAIATLSVNDAFSFKKDGKEVLFVLVVADTTKQIFSGYNVKTKETIPFVSTDMVKKIPSPIGPKLLNL